MSNLRQEALGLEQQVADRAAEWLRVGVERIDRTVGGPARRNTILFLAAVLSLDSADQGAIGAVAPDLEPSLHITNFQLGLLVTITSLVAVVFTVPMGMLTDRVNRKHLLMVMIALWGGAELASGFSGSYWMLVIFRVALGGVTAVAAPAVASLTGDFFPPGDRGRIYGFIVAGELIGAGFGVLVAGEISALAGWRPALAILAIPSAVLVWVLRSMPEPARAGQSWIPRGATEVASAEDVERGERPEGAGESLAERYGQASGSGRASDSEAGAAEEPSPSERISTAASATASAEPPSAPGSGQAGGGGADADAGAAGDAGADAAEEANLLEKVQEQGVEPAEEIVLDEEPAKLTLRQAVRYVLKVRTNVIIIVTSSLGYFFFAGLKTFALLYVRGHYGISQGVATILVLIVGVAALAGVVLAGRGADSLIGKGRITARVDIGVVGYTIAALLLFPAILITNIGIALVLIMVAAAGIAAPNATLDAARLDIVPAQLWGRAESVRTVVRTSLEAFAPLIFGYLADRFGGKQGMGFGVAASGYHVPATSSAAVSGLGDAFLVMLVPLAASGVGLMWARRSYPVDVASAGESQQRMTDAQQRQEAARPRRGQAMGGGRGEGPLAGRPASARTDGAAARDRATAGGGGLGDPALDEGGAAHDDGGGRGRDPAWPRASGDG